MEETDRFKICFVGHSHVGKTSLIKALTTGEFSEDVTPTIEGETTDHTIEVDGKEVGLRLSDTQGAEMS